MDRLVVHKWGYQLDLRFNLARLQGKPSWMTICIGDLQLITTPVITGGLAFANAHGLSMQGANSYFRI